MMLNIIYKMAVKVLSGASPEIRNQIKAFLADLEEKAKQTSYPGFMPQDPAGVLEC